MRVLFAVVGAGLLVAAVLVAAGTGPVAGPAMPFSAKLVANTLTGPSSPASPLVLQPLAAVGTGTITGTVTDSSGTGLVGICVSAIPSSGGLSGPPATTVTGGTYSVTGLAAGTYTVQFYAGSDCPTNTGNYATTSVTSVTVTAGGTTANVDATMTASGTITGTVTDSSGTGLVGICVSAIPSSGGLSGPPATTVTGGTYSITGLASGTYTVDFYATSCQFSTGNYATTSVSSVTVTAGGTTANVDATMIAGGTITGTVTDSSGTGLTGICVFASSSTGGSGGGSAVTGTGGTYTITGLAADTYTVSFSTGCGSAGSYATTTVSSVTVTAGGTTANVNATMTAIQGITGTVVDAQTGAPIAGVCAYLYTTAGQRTSDPGVCTASDGSYTLPVATPGSYVVGFLDPSGLHVTTWSGGVTSEASAIPVTVATGTTSTENVSMTEVQGITGTVVDAQTGAPIAGVCAYLYTTAGQRTSDPGVCTASDGSYTLPVATPGSYVVGFLDPSSLHVTTWSGGATSEASATPVTVATGTTSTENVSMGEVQGITGTVLSSTTDQGLAGVCVYADYASGPNVGKYSGVGSCTGTSGTYVLSGLAAGTYTIGYYLPGQAQGPTAPPTTYWYDGTGTSTVTTESAATPVTVSTGVTTPGVGATVP